MIETHVSWVLLAGEFAYKLKKPVDFGFLDFRSLAARRHFCDEEVRLNRRLAPQLYLDVVAITGTPRSPRVGGAGEPIEYAVRMRRFRRDDELDVLAERGALRAAHVDALAARIARFHDEAPAAPPDGRWGAPDTVLAPCVANFEHFARLPLRDDQHRRLAQLREWTLAEHRRLRPLMQARLAAGRVRECHGDLHLANVVLIDGEPVAFDALEFDPALRWIDVISEVAFAAMDLEHRGLSGLARRFVDDYLSAGGDYGGLALLPWYLAYRALVRAKVAALRAGQPDGAAPAAHAAALAGAVESHLALAERFAAPRRRCVALMHGVSGSGKSFAARRLVEDGGWIRLRSDVERKRLAGLGALATSGSAPDQGLYSARMGELTYARLLELAALVLDAGFPVVVDAAFLRAAQRSPFEALAERRGLPWFVVHTAAPETVLRERVAQRRARGDDPSEATIPVLQRQLAGVEPPAGAERARTIEVDTRDQARVAALARELAQRCAAPG